jgi:uncharacterized MAPEG superfamily protein
MQSNELVALELSVVLFILHVLVQAFFARGEFGEKYLFSPRDEKLELKGAAAGRADRALANFVENYGAFIALDLGLIATGHTGGFGAILWIMGRILYLPVYLAGIPVVRTLCWLLSIIGLILMLVQLAGA